MAVLQGTRLSPTVATIIVAPQVMAKMSAMGECPGLLLMLLTASPSKIRRRAAKILWDISQWRRVSAATSGRPYLCDMVRLST